MESTGRWLAEPGIEESHGEHMRMACRARHKGRAMESTGGCLAEPGIKEEPWRVHEDGLQSQSQA